MQIKLPVSAAAIALVAGLGSASAADQFTTLADVEAQAMSSHAMGVVVGSHRLSVTPSGSPPTDLIPDGLPIGDAMGAAGPGHTLAGEKLAATGAAAAITFP